MIITCQRCGAHGVAAEEKDAAVVPARWRRVAVLVAGPGRRITGDLTAYAVADGYWLCPAHLAS